MATLSNVIDASSHHKTLAQPAPESSLQTTIPDDIISRLFSFLVLREQSILGRTCRRLNGIYLTISPIGRGLHALYDGSNNLAIQVVAAAKARALTASEAQTLGVRYQYIQDQKEKVTLTLALQNFSTHFRERLRQCNIQPGHADYSALALYAINVIRCNFIELTTDDQGKTDALQRVKTDMVINDFGLLVLVDMCNAYANRAVSEITIESYKDFTDYLKSSFPKIERIDIEAKLRQAIGLKHDVLQLQNYASEVSRKTPQDVDDKRMIERLAMFYDELSYSVTEITKGRRFASLHSIIG